MPLSKPVAVGLIGAGRIGSFHAESIARRVPDATLSGVADPAPGAAERLAAKLGAPIHTTDVAELLARPDLDAVVIASPARFHADLVEQAAAAGKAVFCEKPMAVTLADADRAIAAAKRAGVPLQVGFNRRWDRAFAEGRAAIEAGKIGAPQLLRSLTRDPGPLGDASGIPPWTIFLETLIHDFDALLWLNPGARAVDVFAVADALVKPELKERGLLDTAVVTVRFDNGAIATAEANFSALYGYDVRGEVFGSAGMVTMGDVRRSGMTLADEHGVANGTWRHDTDLFVGGYTAQLAAFADCAREGGTPAVTGEDARAALAIALAAVRSVAEKRPVTLAEVEAG